MSILKGVNFFDRTAICILNQKSLPGANTCKLFLLSISEYFRFLIDEFITNEKADLNESHNCRLINIG